MVDYSKVDWSRCKLPTCGQLPVQLVPLHNGAQCVVDNRAVAIRTGDHWTFFPVPVSNKSLLGWAINASDAVDAFLREEERRVELESQPWMTPNELLIYLAKNKGPIRVQSSNCGNREIEFELRSTCLAHSFPDSPSDMMTQTSLSWFLTNNVNYRIIPQSQPDTPRADPGPGYRFLDIGETVQPGDEYRDWTGEWYATSCAGKVLCRELSGATYRRRAETPRVEKKWRESLIVTGEHKFVALDHEPNSVKLSLTIRNPITGTNSSFPKPGRRVRLTLEVEE